MLKEKELIARAAAYRKLATKAAVAKFRMDFADRARRYEIALEALKRAAPRKPDTAAS